MINEKKKLELLEEFINSKTKFVLPENPIIDDLFRFCTLRRPKKWKRNKRLNKKFRKNYNKYVPESIRHEFMAKIFAKVIKPRLNFDSIARRALTVEPLP